MQPSLTALAELLDERSAQGRIGIVESAGSFTAFNVSAEDAAEIFDGFAGLGIVCSLEDNSESECAREEVQSAFQPYRLVALKPSSSSAAAYIFTNHGLVEWLQQPSAVPVVRLARLSVAFETMSVRFSPWNDSAEFVARRIDADPRKFVREVASNRVVSNNLSAWLLRDADNFPWEESTAKTWASRCVKALAAALANEVEHSTFLVFRGPPVCRFRNGDDAVHNLTKNGFCDIQAAAHWVYDSGREAETRHGLLAAEFARTASNNIEISTFLESSAADALEGAKIAHQLGLSQLSRDSLKALADLRKSVSDEAAKLNDTTRQLAASVATAIFAGVGIVATRVALAPTSEVLAKAMVIIGVVLTIYIASIIVSGMHFVRLQRAIRQQWRSKIYRFLPQHEYDEMVSTPAQRAETGFAIAAWIGGLLGFLLLVAVVIAAQS
jgi:hypothetical protein